MQPKRSSNDHDNVCIQVLIQVMGYPAADISYLGATRGSICHTRCSYQRNQDAHLRANKTCCMQLIEPLAEKGKVLTNIENAEAHLTAGVCRGIVFLTPGTELLLMQSHQEDGASKNSPKDCKRRSLASSIKWQSFGKQPEI